MGKTIEITCEHCVKRFVIPDGEAGAVYTCPYCSIQNRAAHQTGTAGAAKPPLPNWGYYVLGGVIAISLGWLLADRAAPTANPRSINTVAFGVIAEAHGEDFRASAANTEFALAEIEDLVSNTKGADLDPRIRDFARLQVEFERAMAEAVATEREAYEHPERVPHQLWRQAFDYHQTARRLAKEYLPNWVEGLDMRIAHDEKMISSSNR